MKELQKKKNHGVIKKVIFICLILMLAVFLILVALFFGIASTAKLDTELLNSITSPIQIYDNKNEKLAESLSGAPYVKVDDLNDYTLHAFIDVEDRTFFEHNGINIKRIVKAFATNVLSGDIEQGASTITQQLIKNTHLTNEKTYSRKIKEISLALEIEKQYDKKQILEMYLNAIYFGNGCYGIESASNFYFNKPAKDLTLNESTVLAGIIKSPSYYCPVNNIENITQRKNFILDTMFELKSIDEKSYLEAKSQEIQLHIDNTSNLNNQSYFSGAIDEASSLLHLTPSQIASKGYKIYTYFDKESNDLLLKNSINDTNALHNSIILDNDTYGIIAFNSSIKYGATKIKRSPASTIKPILVYAPAVEKGLIQPATILNDNPTTFKENYSPKNINNVYYGKISASDALAKSLNVPAVSILDKLGIDDAKYFASKLGITFDEKDNGLSLALGSMYNGITIKDLVNAYSPFCSNGYIKNATFIKEIKDANGNTIYKHNVKKHKVMTEETSYLVGDMLKNTTQNGTCQSLKKFNFDIRAKSGTNGAKNSNKNTDALCIAQTTAHTVCIWYFSKDYKEENLLENTSVTGLSPTIRIKNIFANLYKNHTPKNFDVCQGVELVKLDKIDYELGNIKLASTNTPNHYVKQAYFNKKYIPKEISSNFIHCIKPVLTYMQKDDEINLKFIARKNQIYEIVQEEYNDGKIVSSNVLHTYTDTEGLQDFTAKIDKNKSYKFYINTKIIQSEKYESSNVVEIKGEQKNTNFWLRKFII